MRSARLVRCQRTFAGGYSQSYAAAIPLSGQVLRSPNNSPSAGQHTERTYQDFPAGGGSNSLVGVKFLRRGESNPTSEAPAVESGGAATVAERSSTTAGKGRPTPKRREAQGRSRGPVVAAPKTSKEARARRKQLRGSKAERKESSAERKATVQDRRARMLAGEEQFLLPRDKGPIKGYVRDIVDARRNLLGLFMPLALVLILSMILSPALQAIVTLGMLIMMLLMIIEGVVLGKIVNNRVRERFPEATESSFSLGWYAFVRASQIRRMRAPKPRVKAGDSV